MEQPSYRTASKSSSAARRNRTDVLSFPDEARVPRGALPERAEPRHRMSFRWSLNPYTGCAHRCTFCFVRAFELRADRPFDDRYGTSIRVKTNIAEVLDRELRRKSWKRELVVVGTATDPYQPAEGRYRL